MTIGQEQVLEALNKITIPDTGQALGLAGTIDRLEVKEATISLVLTLVPAAADRSQAIKDQVQSTLQALPGVEEVELEVRVGLPTVTDSTGPAPAWAERISSVRRVIAVASGKGGVGKSTVAANLALALAGQGHAVGLLDADIYGPSQQIMMGSQAPPAGDDQGRLLPPVVSGVKMISIGLMVDQDQPVIWRGPMLMKALEQLVCDVAWGKLDYLLVDLPPGTGDVALTLCQNVPLAGAVIVTTPQDVALVDARKALHMFGKLAVPVLGIVENMAGFECPACGHVEHVFGADGGRRTAANLRTNFLGAIPLDPAIVRGGDAGTPVVVGNPDSAAAKAMKDIAVQLSEGT